nr:sugar nucleotide-binding protein [Halobellus ramosii]
MRSTIYPDWESDPDRAFSVNVQGTENLAWYCHKHGIPLAFASNMAVIGEPVEFPIGAEHPRDPVSLYGLTKKMNEDGIHDLACGAFPAHLFLTADLYGTHEFGREEVTKETVINIFVRRALDNDTVGQKSVNRFGPRGVPIRFTSFCPTV